MIRIVAIFIAFLCIVGCEKPSKISTLDVNKKPILLSDLTYELTGTKMEREMEPTSASIPKPLTKEEIVIQQYEELMANFSSELDKKQWYTSYRELVCKYPEILPSHSVFDAFSADEVRLACQVVETEAYDQDFDAKCNVASVIWNRLESGQFGKSLTEVTTKPNQFAYGRKKLTEDTILAVMYTYEIEDTSQGAIYFHSGEWKEIFNKAKYIFTDHVGHHFYK